MFGFVVLALGISACSGTDAGDQRTSQPLQPTVESVEIFVPAGPIIVGAPLIISAQTRPVAIGVDLELQFFSDGIWTLLETAMTDGTGEVLFNIEAPGLVGRFAFRARAMATTDRALAVSEAAEITLSRRPSDAVVITWPVEPLFFCAEAPVDVSAGTESAGREVALVTRNGSNDAVAIDRTQLDKAGMGQLIIPECADEEDFTATTRELSVRLPTSGLFSSYESAWKLLDVGPPPITCPEPQPIPMYADNPDFQSSFFNVTNPSTECAAEFTVTGDLFCVSLGDEGGYVLGRRTSSIYLLPAGGSVSYLTDEVFTDSAASCRARLPSGTIEFNLSSYQAQAVAFTAAG